MGGGRLLEVPTVGRAWTGEVLVFWIGGRLQQMVAHGS